MANLVGQLNFVQQYWCYNSCIESIYLNTEKVLHIRLLSLPPQLDRSTLKHTVECRKVVHRCSCHKSEDKLFHIPGTPSLLGRQLYRVESQ